MPQLFKITSGCIHLNFIDYINTILIYLLFYILQYYIELIVYTLNLFTIRQAITHFNTYNIFIRYMSSF